MPAPFIVPFNFRPITVSVKTASYTIPAGKYAQVYVECDSGGIFTIDGSSAVVTAAFTNIDVAVNGGTASYTVPTGFSANLSLISSGGTGPVIINGNSAQSVTASIYTQLFNIGPAGTASIATAVGVQGIQGLATPSNALNRQATFWVTTGTVISGSGNWKAVVQEYNVIS